MGRRERVKGKDGKGEGGWEKGSVRGRKGWEG